MQQRHSSNHHHLSKALQGICALLHSIATHSIGQLCEVGTEVMTGTSSIANFIGSGKNTFISNIKMKKIYTFYLEPGRRSTSPRAESNRRSAPA